MSSKSASTEGRWALYRLLGDPTRLRILALATEYELSVGELSDVLGDSQPNVSRHAASLRLGGLLSERRQGTRSYVRVGQGALMDPVVLDAVAEGRRLCVEEGRLERAREVVVARSQRETVEASSSKRLVDGLATASEVPLFVLGVAQIASGRRFAVDASTEEGAMLDVLAPYFQRVVAVERNPELTARATQRIALRGFNNVQLVPGHGDEAAWFAQVPFGADAVFATRLLRQAVAPQAVLKALGGLLAPGGQLVLIDSLAPPAETVVPARPVERALGLQRGELFDWVLAAGLAAPVWREAPNGYVGLADEGQSPWFVLCATRP